MKIGVLHTLARGEERLLLREFQDRGCKVDRLDLRKEPIPLEDRPAWDAVLLRVISYRQCVAVGRALETWGIPVVNPVETVQICGNKWATSLALDRAGLPTPRTRLALDKAGARRAAEELGWPVVVKPTTGSWGRMVSRCSDPDALEAVVEHKDVLGGPQHQIVYLQEFVEKPDRDTRIFVVGDEAVSAIDRANDHWITNVSHGGEARPRPVDDQMADIATAVRDAVGGEVLGIDLFETEEGWLVNEVNHMTEFRNINDLLDVDLPSLIVQRVLEVAKQ